MNQCPIYTNGLKLWNMSLHIEPRIYNATHTSQPIGKWKHTYRNKYETKLDQKTISQAIITGYPRRIITSCTTRSNIPLLSDKTKEMPKKKKKPTNTQRVRACKDYIRGCE